MQDFLYGEYYADIDTPSQFLQGVPIFEDCDAVKDRALLQKYVSENGTEYGVKPWRHRYLIHAEKCNV